MPLTLHPRPIPSLLLRWFGRGLVWLYWAGLGWVIGDRFLLLTTTGRRTGKQRRVVVEAIHRNREQDFYYVTPGFGPKTHWFRNLQRQPLVCVMAGRRRFQAVAETLPLQDATRELRDYMRRHPLSMKLMLWLLRLRIDDIASQEEFQALAQWMPVVALRQRKG